MRDDPLVHAASAILGVGIVSARSLGGGDLSPVQRLTLADGRTVVAKGGPGPRVEAAMLGAMRAAGVPCPLVLGADSVVLVLEDLGEEGALTRDGARRLGAAVARLHACQGDRYGWDADYAFGPVAIVNDPLEDWPRFWAERRLTHGLEAVPAPLARRVEALARALPERLPRRPAPALLHGDLWSGNVFAARDGGVHLIDPACYHGHAEVDLAMLTLFGALPPSFFDGYGAPAPEAESRRPIYQLWPALVHLRLFGGGYAGLVGRLLDVSGV